jgi:3',5'-cyclic AMP phosphodiesterase CpdA
MDRVILIHLSDIHIGSTAYHNPIWSQLRTFVANGHDNLLIDAFMLLWRYNQLQLRTLLGLSQHEALHVAVTGDLTRVGSVVDFRLAMDFLNHSWSTPKYNPPVGTSVAGLELNRVKPGAGATSSPPFVAVPGNHDQWAGSWWFGAPAYSPFNFQRHVGPTYRLNPYVLTSAGGAIRVEIYGVDSNSGLIARPFQPFQGGDIDVRQLQGLETSLRRAGPAPVGVIRVCLCHHGFDHVGGLLQPLSTGSSSELLRIASLNGVSVVLTGHSHYVDWRLWRTSPHALRPLAKPVWELRSTTPFQGPAANSTLGAHSPTQRTVCHGFLVHEISMNTGQKLTWTMQVFLWDGGQFTYYGSQDIALP